jgi:hypothetical protein
MSTCQATQIPRVPTLPRCWTVPDTAHQVMLGVWAVEIVADLPVAVRPQLGGFVVAFAVARPAWGHRQSAAQSTTRSVR